MYVAPEIHENCTPTGLQEFPDWISEVDRPIYKFIAISIVMSFYLFISLAIICDEFFVPTMERLCYKLNMTYDIAGATFMAVATSSPEFFVHCVATFVTKGDIGIGTIVGSSVFNTLAVVAICGLFSKAPVALDWWPITRDVMWYIFAVTVLTSVIVDATIYWYEGMILVSLYSLNLTSLIYDREIQHVLRNPGNECFPWFKTSEESDNYNDRMDTDPQYNDEEPYNLLGYPSGESVWSQLYWLLCWPIELIYFLTVPNVRRAFGRKLYPVSAVMCVVWISILSYLIAWAITVFGYNLWIPDSVMGITFLAAGTSIPEAIASIIVTRKGYGSMAVCNSLSSNTFDIFICLGFPWFLKGYFFPSDPAVKKVLLNSAGMQYVALALTGSAAAMYCCFMVTRFQFGQTVGMICMIMYFVYVAIACMIETNLFAEINLPSCPYMRNLQ